MFQAVLEQIWRICGANSERHRIIPSLLSPRIVRNRFFLSANVVTQLTTGNFKKITCSLLIHTATHAALPDKKSFLDGYCHFIIHQIST